MGESGLTAMAAGYLSDRRKTVWSVSAAQAIPALQNNAMNDICQAYKGRNLSLF